ncbi:hypothetical protein [Streptomyces sp. NPDC050287]|uniref:hypothetical protein n=1 Tax=Streptomyces sp. NPDC050287 TaxID=3365608 RepID=UPI0037B19A54
MPIAGVPDASGLLARRLAWQRGGQPHASQRPLAIAVLATYTADPLVPYLGTFLEEAGLPVRPWVGPIDQIVQQCVDDSSETAAFRPDLLVVIPRFEELWSDGRPPMADPEGEPDPLVLVADAAVEAAYRWGAALVFVLPSIPPLCAWGVGGDAASDGLAAPTGIREGVRARLAGRPSVFLADMEEVIRGVGTRHAFRPALFRLARVPYTQLVYGALAHRLARIVRLRAHGSYQAVIIDGDSILGEPGADGAWSVRDGCELVVPLLRPLDRDDVRITLRHTPAAAGLWAAPTPELELLATDVLSGWAIDEQSVTGTVRDLTSLLRIRPRDTAIVTADPELVRELADAGSECSLMLIGPSPDDWQQELDDMGLFDVLLEGPPSAPPAGGGPPAAGTAQTLERFLAGLRLELGYRTPEPHEAASLAEMLRRTHDFTLGIELSQQDITGAITDPSSTVLLVTVRDRFGDHGTSAAVGVRWQETVCTVDLFLVSCPVLGRGVERAVAQRIAELALERSCDTVRFRCKTTGRNRETLQFLQRLAVEYHAPGDGAESTEFICDWRISSGDVRV